MVERKQESLTEVIQSRKNGPAGDRGHHCTDSALVPAGTTRCDRWAHHGQSVSSEVDQFFTPARTCCCLLIVVRLVGWFAVGNGANNVKTSDSASVSTRRGSGQGGSDGSSTTSEYSYEEQLAMEAQARLRRLRRKLGLLSDESSVEYKNTLSLIDKSRRDLENIRRLKRGVSHIQASRIVALQHELDEKRAAMHDGPITGDQRQEVADLANKIQVCWLPFRYLLRVGSVSELEH